ncbi:MAG TPA: hypothetical protein VMB73_23425, partial [Acetobacteraceae bacterium]|nr:hypothetical protein [Acetobacteraceae bacterium]
LSQARIVVGVSGCARITNMPRFGRAQRNAAFTPTGGVPPNGTLPLSGCPRSEAALSGRE